MVSCNDQPSLIHSLSDAGFTPKRNQAGLLFEVIADRDAILAEKAERALSRLGSWAAAEAMKQLPVSTPPSRGRLCRLIGRIVQQSGDPLLIDELMLLLRDQDAKTRRNAIIALGKIKVPGVETALLSLWTEDISVEHRRSLAAALGKVGGQESVPHLRSFVTNDAELKRIIGEGILKIERTLARQIPSNINMCCPSPSEMTVAFHCRSGLEELLCEEIGSALSCSIKGYGQVETKLTEPMARLWNYRSMIRFGFPLPPVPLPDEKDLAETIAKVITAPYALSILHTWSQGMIRYRLEWAKGGHRRAMTWQCAEQISRQQPDLMNDPSQSLWEAIIDERDGQLWIELWPRGGEDPRFNYRRRTLPASSHPTLAAALAHLAGVQPQEVVWDPFVGSATEIIERSLLGPAQKYYGTDLDPVALDAARENLAAAGIHNCKLALADASFYEPREPVNLIITNPPMGRRISTRENVSVLLSKCLSHWAWVLAKGGRLVWISPLFYKSIALAEHLGLKNTYRRVVDMGGFSAEIQRFVKSI